MEHRRKHYIGSSRNNIDSLDYLDEWKKYFRVRKYNPYCPINKLKKFLKARSFLELNDITDTSSKNEYVKKSKMIPNLSKNPFSFIESISKTNIYDNNSLKLLSNFFSFLKSNEKIKLRIIFILI